MDTDQSIKKNTLKNGCKEQNNDRKWLIRKTNTNLEEMIDN